MFWQLNCVLMLHWLFGIKLCICIKMDLALDNQQKLICHNTQTNEKINKYSFFFFLKCPDDGLMKNSKCLTIPYNSILNKKKIHWIRCFFIFVHFHTIRFNSTHTHVHTHTYIYIYVEINIIDTPTQLQVIQSRRKKYRHKQLPMFTRKQASWNR